MSATLGEQYFVKALDSYPYDLEVFLEQIGYALSYDQDHPGVNCLLGKYHWEQMCDAETAVSYLDQALMVEPGHMPTLTFYASMSLEVEDWDRCHSLIEFALSLSSSNKFFFYHLSGRLQESQMRFEEARSIYRSCVMYAMNAQELCEIDESIARVQRKIDAQGWYRFQ